MDLQGIVLREVTQTEKDKCHVISLICGISRTGQRENKLMGEKGKGLSSTSFSHKRAAGCDTHGERPVSQLHVVSGAH